MLKSNTKTCGGKLIISVFLPKAINKNNLYLMKNLGFSWSERLLKNGLLSLDDKTIMISGSLSNRIISIYCIGSLSESDCKSYVDKKLEEINKMLQ